MPKFDDIKREISTHPLAKGLCSKTRPTLEEEDSHIRSDSSQDGGESDGGGVIGGSGGNQWSMPPASTNSQYPHNHVTSSGRHILEMDETPGNERFRIAHGHTGSAIEMDQGGNLMMKSPGDQFLSSRNFRIGSAGETSISAAGDMALFSSGNLAIESGGPASIQVGDLTIFIKGNLSIVATDEIQLQGTSIRMVATSGDIDLNAKGEMNLESGSETNISSKGVIGVESTGGNINTKSSGSTNIISGGNLNLDYAEGHFGDGKATDGVKDREKVVTEEYRTTGVNRGKGTITKYSHAIAEEPNTELRSQAAPISANSHNNAAVPTPSTGSINGNDGPDFKQGDTNDQGSTDNVASQSFNGGGVPQIAVEKGTKNVTGGGAIKLDQGVANSIKSAAAKTQAATQSATILTGMVRFESGSGVSALNSNGESPLGYQGAFQFSPSRTGNSYGDSYTGAVNNLPKGLRGAASKGPKNNDSAALASLSHVNIGMKTMASAGHKPTIADTPITQFGPYRTKGGGGAAYVWGKALAGGKGYETPRQRYNNTSGAEKRGWKSILRQSKEVIQPNRSINWHRQQYSKYLFHGTGNKQYVNPF